jgi:hypothetical protein
MSDFDPIRQKALAYKLAELELDRGLLMLAGLLCDRLGIPRDGHNVANYMYGHPGQNNIRAVEAWLRSIHEDWSKEIEFSSTAELAQELDNQIRRNIPEHLLGG